MMTDTDHCVLNRHITNTNKMLHLHYIKHYINSELKKLNTQSNTRHDGRNGCRHHNILIHK